MGCFEYGRVKAEVARNRKDARNQKIEGKTKRDKIVVNTKVEFDITYLAKDVCFEV